MSRLAVYLKAKDETINILVITLALVTICFLHNLHVISGLINLELLAVNDNHL